MIWVTTTNEWLESQRKIQDERDARKRARRSFIWGLMIDVSTAVVLVLATAFNAI